MECDGHTICILYVPLILHNADPNNVVYLAFTLLCADGFSFPGKVHLASINPEEGACVFSIDSNCSVDDYLPSTSCSNCYYDGSVFICNSVPAGESCNFTLRATVYNFTSLRSDPVDCTHNTGGEYEYSVVNMKLHTCSSIHVYQ